MIKCSHTGLPTVFCAHCVNGLPKQVKSKSVKKSVSFTRSLQAKRVYPADSTLLAELGLEAYETDTPPIETLVDGRIRCTFCGSITPIISATRGISKFEVEKESEVISINPEIVQTSINVRTTPSVACPDCCHLIKPIMEIDSEGNLQVKVKNSPTSYDPG